MKINFVLFSSEFIQKVFDISEGVFGLNVSSILFQLRAVSFIILK
jgi:hypothetical protein